MRTKNYLLLIIAALLPIAAWAGTYTQNGIYYGYDTSSGTAYVSGNSGVSGDITILSSFTVSGKQYSVTSIGDNAFLGSGLTTVTIPNSVTSIGNYAFVYCHGLTTVTIPNSVTGIGSRIFYDCSGLTSIVVESGNTVYDSRNNCNAIIKTETNELIAGCKNTIIPNSVTSIGLSAFSGCGLTSVTIPNSVTSIENYAFSGCSCLTSVIIPNSVKSIGNSAFEFCSSLTSIVVESDNTVYDSRNNCNAIIKTETNELIASCKTTTIPNSVTSIGWGAFAGCSGLTSITIPNSVTRIGEYAFYRCYDLTSITIPNSVTSIGFDAFEGCSGLTAVVSEIETPFAFGNSAFAGIASTCTLIVPAGTKAAYIAAGWTESVFKGGIIESSPNIIFADSNVKAICVAKWDTNGDGKLSETEAAAVKNLGTVFNGNETIKSFDELQYFTGLTSIGDWAFADCSGLTSVTIPNSVTSIGDYAFNGCSSMTSVTIPNSVTSIGDAAFYGCSSLTSVTIGNSVTSIGWGAFGGCSGLTSIVVESGNTVYDSRNNCNAIIKTETNELIAGCKTTTIPNSVTSIGVWAFAGCSGLTSITIPNSVTSIGNYAFYDCSGLTSITIPNSVTSIGEYAFSYCSGLTSIVVESGNTVYDSRNNCNAIIKTETNELIAGCKTTTIPNSVTGIGYAAFYGCSGLTSVTIPNSVTSISGYAFEYCNSLQTIYFNSTTPPSFGTSVLDGTTCPIYVPNTSVEKYKAASNFGTYTSRIQPFSAITGNIIPNSDLEGTDVSCFYTKGESGNVTDTSIYATIVDGAGKNGTRGIVVNSVPAIYNNGNYEKWTTQFFIHLPIALPANTKYRVSFDYKANSNAQVGTEAHAEPGSYLGWSPFGNVNFTTSWKHFEKTGTISFEHSPKNNMQTIAFDLAMEDYENTYYFDNIVFEILEYPEHPIMVPDIPEGYVELKKSDFLKWSDEGANAAPTGDYNINVEWQIGKVLESGATVAGNPSVNSKIYADLTPYSELMVVCSPASSDNTLTIRLLFNREYQADGQGPLQEIKLSPDENGYAGFNLSTLDKEYAHLNAIKIDWDSDSGVVFYVLVKKSIITFADAKVKAICVENWDTNGDGELSETEAAAVKNLGTVFNGNETIKSFDELQYFTGLTSIGDGAFYLCSGLTSVTIPNSVTSIGERAFQTCSGLTSITIPKSVTSIGNSAFYGCRGLTSITIPNSVTSIGIYAFSACSGLTSVAISNSVTSIENYAFSRCSGLTSVTIPNSVTNIGYEAFSGCSGLTSITIPNSVTSINGHAFYGCNGLTSVTIPNSVTYIGNDAFNGCSGLTSVHITDVAAWCGIEFKDPGSNPLSYANHLYLNGEEVKDLVIPNSVTRIGEYAFYRCYDLTSITIPNSVTRIGSCAFSGCYGLTSITIPKSVTSIGNYAFSGCSGLTFIVVESGNTVYDSRNNCNAIIKTESNVLITGCMNTVIPNSVTSIGEGAFRECSGLTSVTIPNSVTSIGDRAFYGCSGLTAVVSEIETPFAFGNSAFAGIASTCTLTVPAGTKAAYIAAGWTESVFKGGIIESSPNIIFADSNVKAICVAKWDTNGDGKLSETEAAAVKNLGTVFNGNTTIKSFDELQYFTGLTSIGDQAFQYCNGLTSITIPNSVTSIGEQTFQFCSDLTSITIPNSVTSIGVRAFQSCSSLTSVTIPNSVTSIGDWAFSFCTGLTSIKVESGNTVYDSRNNCNAIIKTKTNELIAGCKNTTIPNSVTSIGDHAFADCSGLTSVTIPNSVTKIGSDAFALCSNLTSITIPSSVNSIGDAAFALCSDLEKVYSMIKEPFEISDYVFTNTMDGDLLSGWTTATLYVPAGTKKKYQSTAGWKNFTNIIEVEYGKLWLGESSGYVGSQVELPVYAKSDETVVGVSFTLSLPEGVTVATDEDDEPIYQLNSARLSSKQFNVTTMGNADGTWSFRISPSTKTAVMKAGDGPIMTITLTAAANAQPGAYDVKLTENKLAIRSGDDMVESLETDDSQATLTLSLLMGDVNGDEEVDLSDAIMVIYYSLGVHPTLFREFTADMNGDGQIDLADAIIIIYMDLDAQEGGRAVRRDGDVNSDMAANNRVWLSGKDGRIALQLDNETAFVGMQCDITLPMGATLCDLRLEDGRSEGHTLLYNQTGADTYRVVVYPSTASAFSGSTGSLLSFATMGQQGTVKIENIFFVDTQMKKHTFADLSDETTGIVGVAHLNDNVGDVYDLQGRKANTQSSMLKKGVYIINGKKQVK